MNVQRFFALMLAVAGATAACGNTTDSRSDGAGGSTAAPSHGGSAGVAGGGAPSLGGSTQDLGGTQNLSGHANGGASDNTGGKTLGSGGNAAGGKPSSGGAPSAGTTASSGAGSGGLGGDHSAVAPITSAFCAAARACCQSVGPMGPLGDCENQLLGQLDTLRLADQGSVGLDPVALSACVAAYEQAKTSCALSGLAAACRSVWKGTKPVGAPCMDVAECDHSQGAMLCLRNLAVTAQTDPGVCARPPRGKAGAACSQSCALGADCSGNFSGYDADPLTTLCYEEDGLFCSLGEDEPKCVPVLANGVECQFGAGCASNSYCDTTCQPKSKRGEACRYNYGCEADLTCENGHCADAPLASAELCMGNLDSSGLN